MNNCARCPYLGIISFCCECEYRQDYLGIKNNIKFITTENLEDLEKAKRIASIHKNILGSSNICIVEFKTIEKNNTNLKGE